MDSVFYTADGMLRLRWWLPAIFLAVYGLRMFFVLAFILDGAEWVFDPFWDASLIWMTTK